MNIKNSSKPISAEFDGRDEKIQVTNHQGRGNAGEYHGLPVERRVSK